MTRRTKSKAKGECMPKPLRLAARRGAESNRFTPYSLPRADFIPLTVFYLPMLDVSGLWLPPRLSQDI